MPYARCPTCNRLTHLNIGRGNLEEWYRCYWPGVAVGAEVPAPCFECWKAAGGADSVAKNAETNLASGNDMAERSRDDS